MARIFTRDQIPFSGSSHELQGFLMGEAVPISLILIDMAPGAGPDLHSHPYAEVFIVLEGQARYTVGDAEYDVAAGQVVIAEPNEPHKFVNTGDGPLRQVDIHCHGRFVTEWLEGDHPA